MQWSVEQQQAIWQRDKDVLVAAAAGSGKTAVLVERIIHLLLEDEIDVDRILVVTFTAAAAAEMRMRIGRAIEKVLNQAADEKDWPKMQRMERQLLLLNNASISTLHAFCKNLLQRYFHIADIDSEFRLANEQEIGLLKNDVIEAMLEEEYAKSNNDLFLRVADCYGNERGDDELINIIFALYENSLSQPFPNQWLQSLPQAFHITEETHLADLPWMKIVRERVVAGIEQAEQILQHLPVGEVEALNSDEELVQGFKQAFSLSWDSAVVYLQQHSFSRLAIPKAFSPAEKEWIKKQRNNLKDIIQGLEKRFFRASEKAVLADLASQEATMGELCRLTQSFATSFAQAKKKRSILDFSDLEHFALRVLAEPESTAEKLLPSPIAKQLSQYYREVMVDEYQDTNGVQEAIIKLLLSPETHSFLVGDVKQSIYRFRLAEPELFLQKYQAYPSGSKTERIDLAQNFRSQDNILQTVNALFSHLLIGGATELEYGSSEALKNGFQYEENANTIDHDTEVWLMTDEEKHSNKDNLQREALFIAERIKMLMRAGRHVYDKQLQAYRPVIYRDIVILLRSASGRAEVLLTALKNANIPAYANINSGYFAETEIRTMLALLQIIDNPQQDIPLVAVLFSPLFSFTAEELGEIRTIGSTDNFYLALLCYRDTGENEDLRNKIASFLEHLHDWREFSRYRSVANLIWHLYDETNFYDYCGTLPGGLLRQANLRMLYERAYSYEKTDYRGLFRFLQFVGKLQKAGTDLSSARTMGENEDVVRIMTVHKSKGLEFPIVILANLQGGFNLQDSHNALLIHRRYGLGPYCYQEKYHARYPTLARQAIAEQINNESKAEELRILYVALTRAREKLILTGTLKNGLEQWSSWQDNSLEEKLRPYQVMQARSYLDWFGYAIFNQLGIPETEDKPLVFSTAEPYVSHWKVHFINPQLAEDGDTEALEQGQIWQYIANRQLLPDRKGTPEWIENRLHWQYPFYLYENVPAKLSITEIKRRFSEESRGEMLFDKNSYKRPQFLQGGRLTGLEYGTLMHSVMQHLDLQGDLSIAGIDGQLRNMAEREIISPADIPRIKKKAISSFFQTTLGKKLCEASIVRRELPFSRMIRAERFY